MLQENMFNKKFFLIFLFLFLFLILPMISAVKPIDSIVTAEGYAIEPVFKDYIRTNEMHEFELHIVNVSNGNPITTGIGCYMHLYHKVGNHHYEGYDDTVGHNFDYAFDVDGGNFSSRGIYHAKFNCNDSVLGGIGEIEFGVNDYGEELTPAITSSHNNSIWALVFFFTLCLIGVFTIENPTGKLATYLSAHVLFIGGSFAEWQFLQGYSMAYMVNAGIYKTLFYVSAISFFPMIILSMVWIFYIHLMNDTIKGFMDRGMDEDSAYRKAGGKKYG